VDAVGRVLRAVRQRNPSEEEAVHQDRARSTSRCRERVWRRVGGNTWLRVCHELLRPE